MEIGIQNRSIIFKYKEGNKKKGRKMNVEVIRLMQTYL